MLPLPPIEGLDTAAGLRFFAGRSQPYLRALQTFAALYAGGLQLPEAATKPPADARTPGLQQAAHSLAGASLVLGAATLGAQAQRLSTLLAAGVADDGHADLQLQLTQRLLADLVRQLQARLPAA